MLTLAVQNPAAASGQIFNCVTDRAVTLDGMAKLCAKAAGTSVEIVHYDPKAVGVDAKKAFPFRNMVSSYIFLSVVRWKVHRMLHFASCYRYWSLISAGVPSQHFYAEPRAAKEILGWSATTNLPEDLKERFDEYVKIGRDKKEMKFELDDKILEALKVPVAA